MAYVSKYVIFNFEGSAFQVELADFGGRRGGQPYRYSIFVHARTEGAADVITRGMKGIRKQILPNHHDLVDADGDLWSIIQARRCGFSAEMNTPTAIFHITFEYKGKRPAVVTINHSGESLISVPLTDIEEQIFTIERDGANFRVLR